MTATIKERTIYLCQGNHCVERGAAKIRDLFKKTLEEHQYLNGVKIQSIECQKLCKFGPIAIIKPDNILYVNLNGDTINKIIEEHMSNDKIVDELLFRDPKTGTICRSLKEAQHRLKGKKKSKKFTTRTEKTSPNNEEKARLKEKKAKLKEQNKNEIKALKKQLKLKYKQELKEKKAQVKNKFKKSKVKIKSQQ